MNRFHLFFTHGSGVRLYRTEFWMGERRSVSIRGSRSRSSDGFGAFQWTKGVRALSVLAVITALSQRDRTVVARLEGERSSSAARLDCVLSKEPGWIIDMFGNHAHGAPAIRRLFARSNPGGKRAGPVAVAFAPSLSHGEIEIYVDGYRTSDLEGLGGLLRELLAPF